MLQKPIALILRRTNPQRCPVWSLLKVSRVRRVNKSIMIKAKITTEARAREKKEGKRDNVREEIR